MKNKLINNPRESRKSIIKIVNINEIKNGKTIKKIKDRKFQFFGNILKMEKLLAKLTKKEKSQLSISGMKEKILLHTPKTLKG